MLLHFIVTVVRLGRVDREFVAPIHDKTDECEREKEREIRLNRFVIHSK